jgi:aspartokinase
MKLFFWVLVAVNIILFSIMFSGVLNEDKTVFQPLHAEKITLMTPEPAHSSVAIIPAQSTPVIAPVSTQVKKPEISVPAPIVAKVPPIAELSCFEWGSFSGSALDRAANALEKLSLGNKLSRRNVDRMIGYWVYIAPLMDKTELDQRIAQLNAQGVRDHFVVQDAGQWHNAISLGLFKNHESAQSFFQQLKNKGINSIQLGERAAKKPAIVFLLNDVDTQMSAKLTSLQKEFATSNLKTVQCH